MAGGESAEETAEEESALRSDGQADPEGTPACPTAARRLASMLF